MIKGSAMDMSGMFRKMALGWLVLGLVILVVVVIIAINHYIFGAPVHEAHSGGRLATPTEVAEKCSSGSRKAENWAMRVCERQRPRHCREFRVRRGLTAEKKKP